MEHDKKLIEKIAIQVQTEYQMGGLADGLYLDFATDVAIRYANVVLPQADVSGQVCDHNYRFLVTTENGLQCKKCMTLLNEQTLR